MMHGPAANVSAAPAMLEIERGEGMERGDSVQIQVLTHADMGSVAAILNEGFGTKACCCCFSFHESAVELSKRYTKCPAKLDVGAIAKNGDGAIVGVLLMAEHGMPVYPPGLHRNQPGEIYIEQIAVSATTRNLGVGGRLLDWAENTARQRGATVMSLGVLRGNPAIRLYERKGFIRKETGCCEECCGVCCVFIIMGRPYGLCSPHFGGFDMSRPLAT